MTEPWYFIDKEELISFIELLDEKDLVYIRLRGDGRTASITVRDKKRIVAIPAKLGLMNKT